MMMLPTTIYPGFRNRKKEYDATESEGEGDEEDNVRARLRGALSAVSSLCCCLPPGRARWVFLSEL
jgi:hypothetical protein